MDNPLRLIDEIEQMVENGKGWMGQRLINEEAFFVKIQQLRIALPAAMKNAAPSGRASKAVNDLIEESRLLTEREQLQIIAALAARLSGG